MPKYKHPLFSFNIANNHKYALLHLNNSLNFTISPLYVSSKKEKYSLKNGWGTDLYECDLAIDIEDDFTELYNVYMNRKMTKDELVQEMEKRYKNILNDSISGPVFWIILADQQWPNQVLTEYTKAKALEGIEQDLVNWKDKEGYSQRKEELDLLKEELENYIFK